MILPDFVAGQVLTAADLTASRDAIASMLGSADGTGIREVSLPSGTATRFDRRPEIWVAITGGGTSGIYAGTQQLESAPASGATARGLHHGPGAAQGGQRQHGRPHLLALPDRPAVACTARCGISSMGPADMAIGGPALPEILPGDDPLAGRDRAPPARRPGSAALADGGLAARGLPGGRGLHRDPSRTLWGTLSGSSSP